MFLLIWHAEFFYDLYVGTLAAPLALLRAEIVLKRRPNFGGSAKDTQVNFF
jgi:hypothetical protein